jgi:hypothetical protein
MHFQAKPLLDFGKEDWEKEDERRIRLVRFAGVVQRAFEGKVAEEARGLQKRRQETVGKGDSADLSLATQGLSPGIHQPAANAQTLTCPRQRQMIQAKGYVAGTVVHLGPTYRAFVGLYPAHQHWVASWDTHYHEARDLEKLRQMEDTYSTKIIDYSETDLARICLISNNSTVAWEVLAHPPPTAELIGFLPHYDDGSEPIRFLGSDFCMGLAPTGVRVGDLVVRFWNCDAAVIVRRGVGDQAYLHRLVGRADVAEPDDQRRGGMDNTAKDAMRSFGGDGDGVSQPGEDRDFRSGTSRGLRTKAMYVRLDFETLQLISAGIAL